MKVNFTGRYRQAEGEWIGWVEGNPIISETDPQTLASGAEVEYEGLPEISARGATVEEVQNKLAEKIAETSAQAGNAAQRLAEDRLTDSLATDYIITRDFLH